MSFISAAVEVEARGVPNQEQQGLEPLWDKKIQKQVRDSEDYFSSLQNLRRPPRLLKLADNSRMSMKVGNPVKLMESQPVMSSVGENCPILRLSGGGQEELIGDQQFSDLVSRPTQA